MGLCTEELSTLIHAEASTTSLKFLDLTVGGFTAEAIELTVPIPKADTHVFVFVREGGRWVELEGCVRRHKEKLRVTVPGGPLRHIAVAFVPSKMS